MAMREWAERRAPSFGWDSLTGAELRVADLVSWGYSNREAAGELFVSPHTVDAHLRSIFTKLGVRSRVELTRVVVEQSLASAPLSA